MPPWWLSALAVLCAGLLVSLALYGIWKFAQAIFPEEFGEDALTEDEADALAQMRAQMERYTS